MIASFYTANRLGLQLSTAASQVAGGCCAYTQRTYPNGHALGDRVPTASTGPSRPLLHMRLKAFAGPFGVCYQVVTRTTWQLVAVTKRLTSKEHQLPNSCCCRRAFTRDHPLSGFPAGQPPYLHGPVPDLPASTAVPVQELYRSWPFDVLGEVDTAQRSGSTPQCCFLVGSAARRAEVCPSGRERRISAKHKQCGLRMVPCGVSGASQCSPITGSAGAADHGATPRLPLLF